jgi:DNA-binding MarR family transcriptional regulator
LSIIRERPGLGVNDLAAAMDIHQSTASNLVRSLVSRDMVLAEKAGHDRRQVHLRVRPVGLTLLDRAPGPLTGVLLQALASLDDLTLQRLDADLAKLISVLDGDDSGARVPLGD